MARIDLDSIEAGAGRGLLPPEPGNPRINVQQRPTERLHLSDATAELPFLDTLSEGVKPALPLERLDGVAPREVALNRNLVAFPGPLHHIVRLLMQSTGVQGENRDRRLKLRQHIDHHHVFGPKTAGERQ